MQMPISSDLEEAAQSLIDNLLASDPFVHYETARRRMNEDPEARDLLHELSQAQARMRQGQTHGSVTPAEVEALREIQLRVQNSPVIMDYADSQQAAIDFLREINAEINSLLGVNFASFANHSTC